MGGSFLGRGMIGVGGGGCLIQRQYSGKCLYENDILLITNYRAEQNGFFYLDIHYFFSNNVSEYGPTHWKGGEGGGWDLYCSCRKT